MMSFFIGLLFAFFFRLPFECKWVSEHSPQPHAMFFRYLLNSSIFSGIISMHWINRIINYFSIFFSFGFRSQLALSISPTIFASKWTVKIYNGTGERAKFSFLKTDSNLQRALVRIREKTLWLMNVMKNIFLCCWWCFCCSPSSGHGPHLRPA